MERILSFDEFVNESWEDIDMNAKKNAAGVAIIWDDKILLVHPTNASWQKSALGIPKGGIDDNEDPLDAAVRELYEETGIQVTKEDLNKEPYVCNFINASGVFKWQLVYFELHIDRLSQIGLDGPTVPKSQLQMEEIDWAGFVPIMQAYHKIHKPQMIILDRLT